MWYNPTCGRRLPLINRPCVITFIQWDFTGQQLTEERYFPMYEDKTLVCKECGKEFVFTAGEQEFYAERGFQNEPQRCKACRDAGRRLRAVPHAAGLSHPHPPGALRDGAGLRPSAHSLRGTVPVFHLTGTSRPCIATPSCTNPQKFQENFS